MKEVRLEISETGWSLVEQEGPSCCAFKNFHQNNLAGLIKAIFKKFGKMPRIFETYLKRHEDYDQIMTSLKAATIITGNDPWKDSLGKGPSE